MASRPAPPASSRGGVLRCRSAFLDRRVAAGQHDARELARAVAVHLVEHGLELGLRGERRGIGQRARLAQERAQVVAHVEDHRTFGERPGVAGHHLAAAHADNFVGVRLDQDLLSHEAVGHRALRAANRDARVLVDGGARPYVGHLVGRPARGERGALVGDGLAGVKLREGGVEVGLGIFERAELPPGVSVNINFTNSANVLPPIPPMRFHHIRQRIFTTFG